MSQASLLPIVCTRINPPPATAAAEFIGVDEATTHRWLCKGQGRHAGIPATEWLCSSLATALGFPVPVFAVVERFDQPGTPYFGSQWQGGAKSFVEVMGRISNPELFGKTLAFDTFSHNTDRHEDNFLYLDLAGEIVARVIDFSHAWFVAGWPLPALPLSPCNTVTQWPALRAQHRTPYAPRLDVLDAIAVLPGDWMERTCDRMPAPWREGLDLQNLTAWWQGGGRAERIHASKSSLP